MHYGNILQFMRVISTPNLVLFSPNPKQRAKTKEALPLPVPTNRAVWFRENCPQYGLANKYCVSGIILRSVTVTKTQPDMTDFGKLDILFVLDVPFAILR